MKQEEFTAFYARTSRQLWRYLRKVADDRGLAEDILQESYLRYLGHPCPDPAPPRQLAYLFRIATHLLRDHWRRLQREQRSVDLFAHASSDPTSRRDLPRQVDLGNLLGKLKPRQRALLWLAYVEGYEHREISNILGLRSASVRVLLFRARRQLARLLDQSGLTTENLRPNLETAALQEETR